MAVDSKQISRTNNDTFFREEFGLRVCFVLCPACMIQQITNSSHKTRSSVVQQSDKGRQYGARSTITTSLRVQGTAYRGFGVHRCLWFLLILSRTIDSTNWTSAQPFACTVRSYMMGHWHDIFSFSHPSSPVPRILVPYSTYCTVRTVRISA